MPMDDPAIYASVARARIAAQGFSGLTMRSVAQEAGSSLGSLNHHVGDKAALIASIVHEERRERQSLHALWRRRVACLDLTDAAVLAAVMAAYLDEAALAHRAMALTGCELFVEAGMAPREFPGIDLLLADEDRFWSDLLAPGYGIDANLFARAISGYCHDERPFTIALAGHPDYRLLRGATIASVSAGLAGRGDGLGARFGDLVAACGSDPAVSPLPVDLPDGSKKAVLAQHIARVIAEQGVSAVTHRAVAARAGVSNSRIAHHFRTQADLLDAGFGALILAMRQEMQSPDLPEPERHRGTAMIRATHSIALAAARDAVLQPFALDMRRRRSENVRERLREILGGDRAADDATIQAASMITIGSGLAAMASGNSDGRGVITVEQLAGLRGSFMAARSR